jgi:hypothetical protein
LQDVAEPLLLKCTGELGECTRLAEHGDELLHQNGLQAAFAAGHGTNDLIEKSHESVLFEGALIMRSPHARGNWESS